MYTLMAILLLCSLVKVQGECPTGCNCIDDTMICQSCQQRRAFLNGSCAECSLGCNKCLSPMQCLSCDMNYGLSNSSCSKCSSEQSSNGGKQACRNSTTIPLIFIGLFSAIVLIMLGIPAYIELKKCLQKDKEDVEQQVIQQSIKNFASTGSMQILINDQPKILSELNGQNGNNLEYVEKDKVNENSKKIDKREKNEEMVDKTEGIMKNNLKDESMGGQVAMFRDEKQFNRYKHQRRIWRTKQKQLNYLKRVNGLRNEQFDDQQELILNHEDK